GVNDVFRVEHDGDVAFPEDEVAALEANQVIAYFERRADRSCLHVGIAQDRLSSHAHRELDEAGAVNAEGTGATPEIGRVLEQLGDGDVVRDDLVHLAQVRGDQRFAGREHRITKAARFGSPDDGDAASK